MRGISLKLLSLILLLTFSLTLVETAYASPVLFVDPPEIEDKTKQAPSTFSIKTNVSDVVDLYGWQINMTWDPSIIDLTAVSEGDFLQGPFPWDSHPYDHSTLPIAQQQNTPNSSVTQTAGWDPKPFPAYTLVECVEAQNDGKYIRSETANAEEEWDDFGFNTGIMDSVATLEVGLRSRTNETDGSYQDRIEIQVTNDGGSNWGPTHTIYVFSTYTLSWADVTNDFAWTPAMLTDANFQVRMKHIQINTTDRVDVDYFAVRATDTLKVTNPDGAYDKVYSSYASFQYSQVDGNLTVDDFSHDFPSGVGSPALETSTIVQVDFNMKYNTTASASGDRYKIAYYVDPSPTETVLVGWSSAATSLNNYTWYNKPEPNGGGWNWIDVSNIRIVVETDKVGGDATAAFWEYEAWVTVTYIRPTSMDKNMAHLAEGWCLFSVLSEGEYPGVSGNGTLATVDFDVVAYGETDINITDPVRTYLLDSDLAQMTFTPEDGYFSNVAPGDFDKDGDVDPDDFNVFAAAYGTDSGDASYNPACDFDDDGDVDPDDFNVFAANYGWP